MIYYFSTYELGANWQLAYENLSAKYQLISLDYEKGMQLKHSLKSKIQHLLKENECLKNRKRQMSFPLAEKQPYQQEDSLQARFPLKTEKVCKNSIPRIQKQHSGQTETKHEGHPYECTYEGCKKVYASAVSMNLHIKIKHNGGTKKEREAYARIILQTLQRGDEPPKMDISLPPNFLEEYRTSYYYSRKYSM